ncbi:MAG TPA: hypothetical protein VFM58_24500 [Solirubrobacteraceae bacterium]|nr:hypothetical protein [Solirubrobacteraceae bacterium]
MRTPLAVIAVLFVLLLGGWIALHEDETPAAPAAKPAAPVDEIARRVESLRDLRFEQLPDPVTVTPGQAKEEALEDLDRRYPVQRRRADEALYKTLGLIDPDADLRELTGSLFEQGVAGYYDSRDGRLRVVEGAGTGNRVISEITLAHELDHALEDQQFEFTEPATSDDRALAYTALIEGSATALMGDYLLRYFSSDEALGSLLGSAFQDTGDLPPFLEAQVLFPYLDGETFVADLRRRAGDRWDLVDTAFRLRVPASTEQVLHPDAYFDADDPERVRLHVGEALGAGWTRATAGTWGELQTRELLALAGGNSKEAAAGWGGDRYELWQSGGKNVLVMRWRWDTPKDKDEFADALVEWAGSKLPPERYTIEYGEDAVTLVVAPDRRTAARVMELG